MRFARQGEPALDERDWQQRGAKPPITRTLVRRTDRKCSDRLSEFRQARDASFGLPAIAVIVLDCTSAFILREFHALSP
jgi:hypothetical protein